MDKKYILVGIYVYLTYKTGFLGKKTVGLKLGSYELYK